jgi:hypothetical protein
MPTTSPPTSPVATGGAYARQFKRFANIVLKNAAGDRIDVSDLRFTFEIKQFDIQSPNTAEVIIFNLSEDTSKRISREFTKIVLWAGYESNLGPIFEGTVRQFRRGRNSPVETYFNLRCADGDIAYTQSTINVSLAAGATAEDIVTAVLTALAPQGITRGYITTLPEVRAPRAMTLSGMTRDVLRELTQAWNVVWSIQQNKLTILPINGRALPGAAIVLNSATGMIGMPEQTIDGIQVRALLNPQIVIGKTLRIDNKAIQEARVDLSYFGEVRNAMVREVRITDDGLYRVIAVDHSGDTRGDAWYSDIICVAINDPVPIPQAQRARS